MGNLEQTTIPTAYTDAAGKLYWIDDRTGRRAHHGAPASPSGQELRLYREGEGLTRDEVAELAGVSTSLVKKWERGKQRIPYERFKRIQYALGMDHYK